LIPIKTTRSFRIKKKHSYVFSSTKLERRAKQIVLGSERRWRERVGAGKQGEEMAQPMYAHVNK
jgi:hypothetical protein